MSGSIVETRQGCDARLLRGSRLVFGPPQKLRGVLQAREVAADHLKQQVVAPHHEATGCHRGGFGSGQEHRSCGAASRSPSAVKIPWYRRQYAVTCESTSGRRTRNWSRSTLTRAIRSGLRLSGSVSIRAMSSEPQSGQRANAIYLIHRCCADGTDGNRTAKTEPEYRFAVSGWRRQGRALASRACAPRSAWMTMFCWRSKNGLVGRSARPGKCCRTSLVRL